MRTFSHETFLGEVGSQENEQRNDELSIPVGTNPILIAAHFQRERQRGERERFLGV